MRILVTADPIGGVWSYAATLVRGLTDGGDECLLASIGEPTDEQAASLGTAVALEAADHPLEWHPGATDEDMRRTTEWLRDLAARWGADIVHLNQFAYAAEPFGVPTLLVAHSDVFSWFREVRDAEPGPEWARYRERVRAGLNGASATAAPTCYQSGMLARHYGRPADRVIHNGSRLPEDDARARASERSFVLAAGRAWDEAKGVEVLEEALERLGDRAPSAHLAGSLEGPAGERFVPRRLNAHGQVTPQAMDRLYDNAAIYVANSLYEPFGLSPLEAAGHGCALVLSDIGSFSELWHDAALFVPPAAPAALAGALTDLLEDPARLDALAAIGRARARERYTAELMVERYREFYGTLADNRGGPESKGRRTA